MGEGSYLGHLLFHPFIYTVMLNLFNFCYILLLFNNT